MKILLATRNKNKINEIMNRFSSVKGIEYLSLSDFKDIPEIEETGITFIENALIKAVAVSRLTGMISLADDSGLVVDSLDGRPGIYSARYAGEAATDMDRNMKLLDEMKGIESRSARFICAIAIATPEGKTFTVEGKCEGKITEELKGNGGFGYDPIFFIPEKSVTMAELSLDEKNRISHRAKALAEAEKIIRRLVPDR